MELERSVRMMERNVMAMEAGNHEADDSEAKQKWEQTDKDDSDTDDKDDSENYDYDNNDDTDDSENYDTDDSVTDDSESDNTEIGNLVIKVTKLTTEMGKTSITRGS